MKLLFTLFVTVAFALTGFAQDSTISSAQVYRYAGVPASGTNEIDTITIASGTSAGSFTLTVAGGRTTRAIVWSATDATLIANIDAAVEGLSAVGVGGVTTAAGTGSSGIGTYTLTFTGKNAKEDFPLLTIGTNSLTGGAAPTITTTTPGVAATWASAPTGTLLEDKTNGNLYQNTSTTVGSPTWTQLTGVLVSASPTAGIGYATGAGGAVTQITSRATGVTLNTTTGAITTINTSLAALATATFTVTDSSVAVGDTVLLSIRSGQTNTNTTASVTAVAAGSFNISIVNGGGAAQSTAETGTIIINFAVVKAVSS